jgi:hypothetical protein|tara:strand:+ start:119 stop:280 length:162 start_codon:yes stop_codon:yes gene_type:complete
MKSGDLNKGGWALIAVLILSLILATVSDEVASILVFIIFVLIVFGIYKFFKND